MSSVIPFDIIALIIDIVRENEDTSLLKDLALVSHSFHHICIKHLFANVELHDADQDYHLASSKKGFVKLLKSRPDVSKYIRKLTYKVGYKDDRPRSFIFPPPHPRNGEDDLLSPILPNLLRTISRLNCLKIYGAKLDWELLDSSLTSAFLYLMHLPTINHIDLSFIQGFPLSSFNPSANLHRLDMFYMRRLYQREEDGSPEIIVQSGMMPKIREFHISESNLLTMKLLCSKNQDGQPAFNFTDLIRLSTRFEAQWNLRYLLQNAKSLEKLQLSVSPGRDFVGLHDVLSPSLRTLKILDLTIPLYDFDSHRPALAGLCEELEAMAGHNMLEALSFKVDVDGYETEKFIGCVLHNVEKVLVKPGWSALRQVSFEVTIACCLVSTEVSAKLSEALQSLPDKYLSHLSKHESVVLNYLAYVVKCFGHL